MNFGLSHSRLLFEMEVLYKCAVRTRVASFSQTLRRNSALSIFSWGCFSPQLLSNSYLLNALSVYMASAYISMFVYMCTHQFPHSAASESSVSLPSICAPGVARGDCTAMGGEGVVAVLDHVHPTETCKFRGCHFNFKLLTFLANFSLLHRTFPAYIGCGNSQQKNVLR